MTDIKEALKDVRLFVALPCFGGQMYAKTVAGLLELQSMLMKLDVSEVTTHFIDGESLITRARNAYVHAFFKTECTHLLSIDADIAFRAQDVIGMLLAGKDCVCGAYPRKELDWPRIRQAALRHDEPITDYAASFVLNRLVSETEDGAVMVPDKGCVPIKDAATGFLMTTRRLMFDMCYAYPETRHISDGRGTYGEPIHALFDTGIVDNIYQSEDWMFSHRVRQMGETVWLYLPAKLGHIGKYEYQGNLLTTFEPVNDAETEYSLPEQNRPEYAARMLERYHWAAARIKGKRIANACAGPGYGMPILAANGAEVTNFDRSEECERIATERGWVPFVKCDVSAMSFDEYDALVSIETAEHLPDPIAWLRQVSPSVTELMLSVPCVPTRHKNKFHRHDFSYQEVINIVRAMGWTVLEHQKQCDDVIMLYAVRGAMAKAAA